MGSAVAATTVPPWAAGKRYLYATHLNSKLVLGGQGLMGFDLTTKLSLETRQVGPETEYIARLTQPTFQGESLDAREQFAALARELEEPFGFSTKQGKLSGLRLEAGPPICTDCRRTGESCNDRECCSPIINQCDADFTCTSRPK